MSDLTEPVRAAVGMVIDPELRRPLADLGMIGAIQVDNAVARVDLVLTIDACPMADRLRELVADAARGVPGIHGAEVVTSTMTASQRADLVTRLRGNRPAGHPFGPDSLTRVILVASGKGGVGKSTVTTNLAVALAERGRRVGLVDADVHGFSVPALIGLATPGGRATSPTRLDDMILPPIAHGVKVISIGMFLRAEDEDQAVAWRGPMLHRTLNQFLSDVYFSDLDYLLLDMPPGTGDIALSVGQLLPHAEVIVVTTPQASAATVAVRSGRVARTLGQRVIGVVENMTSPAGDDAGVFGAGGADSAAAALSTPDDPVPVIARIPLSRALRVSGDAGAPLVITEPQDPASVALTQLAEAVDGLGRGLSGRKLRVSAR